MRWEDNNKVAQFIKWFLRHVTSPDHFCKSCTSALELHMLLAPPPDSNVSGAAFLLVLGILQHVCHVHEDSPSSTFAVRLVKIQL
jgi:hypothetical protein